MDYSVTFARHFSRLVWLLLHETGAIDEQKAALRALVMVSKDGPVIMALKGWRLVVNGVPLPDALTGVQDLAAQLIGHAVKELRVDQAAAAADLLGVARILATEAAPGDSTAVGKRLNALGAKTVHVDDPSAPAAVEQPISAPPISDMIAYTTPSPTTQPWKTNDAGVRTSKPMSVHALESGDAATRSSTPVPVQPNDAPVPARPLGDEGRLLMFSVVPAEGSGVQLFAQVDQARSATIVTRLLDELVTLAESAAREGKADVVTDVFHGLVRREAQAGDSVGGADLKRVYSMAVRRMSKPTLLRAVAQTLPRRKDRAADSMAILSRTGEDGADALIEQLTGAQSLADRRVFFDALVHLNAGVAALIHMLGDARWYVARNAADLLGEMQASDAETPLVEMLKHDDDRVRRAAATALAKLGTPKALQALHTALRDNSPQVRLQAAAGLSARKGQKSAATLAKALDDETDAEVQFAILGALGRLATSDAVQKLVRAAEPDGRLFKKKPVAFRVHAVQALGQAHTPGAMAALKSLVNDKEKEVREAVLLAVMQTQRGESS